MSTEDHIPFNPTKREKEKNIQSIKELTDLIQQQFSVGSLKHGDQRLYTAKETKDMISNLANKYNDLKKETAETLEFILTLPETAPLNPLLLATKSANIRDSFKQLLESLITNKKSEQ